MYLAKLIGFLYIFVTNVESVGTTKSPPFSYPNIVFNVTVPFVSLVFFKYNLINLLSP